MARPIRPRPPVTAAPLVVSDATAYDLVGLTARQYRDLLGRHPDVPRAVVGRRLLVRADDLLALVDRLAATSAESACVAAPKRQPETADEVLAELGYGRGRRSA